MPGISAGGASGPIFDLISTVPREIAQGAYVAYPRAPGRPATIMAARSASRSPCSFPESAFHPSRR
ncbi:hypothetical protein BGLA2_640008 [Burkholderia gladioli]|nr:hypothetical protein BGLA2_640008 [Burkholderia gladioli]